MKFKFRNSTMLILIPFLVSCKIQVEKLVHKAVNASEVIRIAVPQNAISGAFLDTYSSN